MSRLITLILILTLLSGIFTKSSNEMLEQYKNFCEKYRKSYETEAEANRRFIIFKHNYDKLNISNNTSIENSEMIEGMTEFMDLTPEEFKAQYLTLNFTELPKNATPYFANDTSTEGRFLQASIPQEWDWRNYGAISPVKNQGGCGGCWAFAAVQNIESLYFLKYGKLPILSVQQVIDCDPNNWGCTGGIIHNTYPYIEAYGLQEAQSYPYQFYSGSCRYDHNGTGSKYRISGYVYSGSSDEEKIKAMLYNYGPLAITINASLLQFYVSGVMNVSYDRCPYGPTHGVVIVGYGTTSDGIDYWTIKNTWGPYWGENGYFRIARGRGLCGVNMYVVSAVVE